MKPNAEREAALKNYEATDPRPMNMGEKEAFRAGYESALERARPVAFLVEERLSRLPDGDWSTPRLRHDMASFSGGADWCEPQAVTVAHRRQYHYPDWAEFRQLRIARYVREPDSRKAEL